MSNKGFRNILILEDSSKSNFGGGQNVTLKVIDSLSDRNVILFDHASDSKFIQLACRKLDKVVRIPGVSQSKTHKVKLARVFFGLFEKISLPYYLLLSLKIVVKVYKDENFSNNETVIYTTTKKCLILGVLASKILRLKLIHHAHSLESNLLVRLLAQALFTQCHQVICVSETVGRFFKSRNSVVLKNASDFEILKYPKVISKSEKIIVAVFASFFPIKGVDVFLRSYSYVTKKNVEYWVFGAGPEEERLREIGKHCNILFKGFVDDVSSALDLVQLVVIPTVVPESFGIVAIESFCRGVPVISTDIGGQAEIVVDGEVGFHVPIRSPDSIAEKINVILSDESLYRKLSANCLKYAESFKLDKFKEGVQVIF